MDFIVLKVSEIFTGSLYYDFEQNVQKLLGFAPSRAVSKQSGNMFGPPPQR